MPSLLPEFLDFLEQGEHQLQPAVVYPPLAAQVLDPSELPEGFPVKKRVFRAFSLNPRNKALLMVVEDRHGPDTRQLREILQ